MPAATPAEWAEAVSTALVLSGATGGLFFLTVDADPSDFDPRPALRRTTAAVHQAAVHAGHDLNRAYATSERLAKQTARDTAITTAALLMLLTASEATR